MSFRSASVGKRSSRVVVALLALMMLCAGSLRHAVERTPINKETAGFKFSKTLELPHKKAPSASIAVVRTAPPVLDVGAFESVLPLDLIPDAQDPGRRATASRAPPLV
jgi:hypothetical protein